MLRLLALLFVYLTNFAVANSPPNVVLIFADDLGYGDLGCYNATKDGFNDKQQVTFQSPDFVIKGEKASFLASGGFDRDSLYVALIEATTDRIFLAAGGPKGPQIKRISWDVSQLKGKTVHLRIVDKNTGGWGHLTFDDFSTKGELLPSHN